MNLNIMETILNTAIREAYMQALKEAADRENKEARKKWGKQTWGNLEQAKKNGSKGGRPPMPKDDLLERIDRNGDDTRSKS